MPTKWLQERRHEAAIELCGPRATRTQYPGETFVSLSLRLKDLLGPVTRVKEKKPARRPAFMLLGRAESVQRKGFEGMV